FENSYWRMEGYAVGVLEAYAAFDSASVGTGATATEEPADTGA
ncbi:major capsid protein, partial [Salinivibrio sp. VYel6]|nr:major capsid protein [Salinivibrio sp. VYel6]